MIRHSDYSCYYNGDDCDNGCCGGLYETNSCDESGSWSSFPGDNTRKRKIVAVAVAEDRLGMRNLMERGRIEVVVVGLKWGMWTEAEDGEW